MFNSFNTEVFILEVKKRPYLWNVNHSSYGARELKLQAWEEIAEILNALCSSGSYADLYTPTNVVEMQRKWKHLRDYYQREKKRALKAPDNTIAGSRKRRSPLLDMLQFLDTNREIEAAVQIYTENNSEEQNNFKETNEEETSNLSETDNSRLNKTQNNKTNENQTRLNDDKFKRDSFSGSEENEDDTDNQFLMDLLPLIKNMSSREKGNFLKRLLNSMPAEDDTAPLSNEVEQSQSVETRKRKPRDKEKNDDSCNIFKSDDVRPSKDDYAIYGQYVANKLRNIRNACARNTAEFKINEILYKAEMGEYDVVTKRRRASSPTPIASSSVKDNPLKINIRYSQDTSSDDEVISNKVYIVKDEVGE